MNDKSWEKSRATYLEYRETKRNLSRAAKAEDRTWKRLEKSFTRFSRAQTAAFLEYEDASQTEKFAKAYEALRVAKIEHDASRKAVKEAVPQFRKVEIQYAVVIMKGLEKVGVSMRDISRIFGIWASNVNRWIRNSAEQDFEDFDKIYEKEYETDE